MEVGLHYWHYGKKNGGGLSDWRIYGSKKEKDPFKAYRYWVSGKGQFHNFR
jgi:hypothetical protein